jgi:hypothetical protein
MKLARLALVLCMAAAAACTGSPTASSAATAGPSMDGNGFTLGGGRSDTTTVNTQGSAEAGTQGNGFTLGGG